MGFGFSFSHKTKDIKNLWENVGKTATDTFSAGDTLTTEGLSGLRDLNSTYKGRLDAPLGTGPNSASAIFARARGTLSDVATQRAGSFGSRIFQQAVQSGGNLSPEAQAELEAQNQRGINQDLFQGNKDISDSEAAATLSETSKLFDRMEGISKTILGVGHDKSVMGLQALIQSIIGRQDLKNQNSANARAAVGTAISAGTMIAGNSGGSTAGNPYTGGH